jgi:predicted small secreted protein
MKEVLSSCNTLPNKTFGVRSNGQ